VLIAPPRSAASAGRDLRVDVVDDLGVGVGRAIEHPIVQLLPAVSHRMLKTHIRPGAEAIHGHGMVDQNLSHQPSSSSLGSRKGESARVHYT
jgi:hypothetical protein